MEVWAKLRPTFDLRMKVLDRMIEIALTNEHWFRPSSIDAHPSHVYRRAGADISLYNLHLERSGWPQNILNQEGYVDLMRAERTSGTTSKTWRKHRVRSLGRSATPQDAAYLAVSDHKVFWVMVPNGWVCPCRERPKLDIIQPSNQFNVSFRVVERSRTLGAPPRTIICGECSWAANAMAKEAGVNSGQISFQDIRDCVIAHPNRSHEVRPDATVDAVIERLRAR